MKHWSSGKDSQRPEKTTVVCVTNQLQCERIIHAGRSVASLSDTRLLVVNVSPVDFTCQKGEALERLFQVSRENGAEMTVLYADDFAKALLNFIKKNRAVNVVTGIPQEKNSVLLKLWEKLGGVSFFTVDEEGNLTSMRLRRQLEQNAQSPSYLQGGGEVAYGSMFE